MSMAELTDFYILVFDMRIMGANPNETVFVIIKGLESGWPA